MDEVAERFEAARQANLAMFDHWYMEKCVLCGEEFGTRPLYTVLDCGPRLGNQPRIYNYRTCYLCAWKYHEEQLRRLRPKIKKPFLQLVTYWANIEGLKQLGGWEEVDDETCDPQTRFADCAEGIE